MSIGKSVVITWPVLLALLLVSCATGTHATKAAQDGYQVSAEVHDAFAKEMSASGNRVISEYHKQEAARMRHNAYANDCGIVDWLISDVVLGADACETK